MANREGSGERTGEGPQERLESWKQIADYLGKGVTTVRRWEREEGLPVHRQEHALRGSVVAYRSELDAWRASRTADPPAAVRSDNGGRWALVAAGAIAAVAVVLLALASRRSGSSIHVTRVITLAGSPAAEGPPDLSADGTRVAYSVAGPDGGLFIQPALGGMANLITGTTSHDQFPRWSPDGKTILFWRAAGPQRELMVIPASGGQPRLLLRLTSPPQLAKSAAWTADGHAVVFSYPDGDGPWPLFRMDLTTGTRVRLTYPPKGSVGDTAPACSPDGRMFSFTRYHRGSEGDLFVSSFESGIERSLTNDSTYVDGNAWEPDSEHIVFHSNRLGAAGRLWRIAVTGNQEPELIAGVDRDATWPSVARVGPRLRIAFQRTATTVNILRWDDPSQPGAQPAAIAPSNFTDVAVQYSPDGSKVAFVSNRGGNREIWLAGADGSSPRALTNLVGAQTDSPRWSPDGSHIVFTTAVDDNRDVYIVPAAGGPMRRLTTEPSEEGRPSWSRDGLWIWFRSDRSGSQQIWKTAAAGGGTARQMTSAGGYEAFESLDGRWLYYTRNRLQPGLWRIPVEGGREELVAERVREGWWSPAKAAIFYLRSKPGLALWRLPDGAGEPERVADVPSPDLGAWTGFSARGDGRSFLYSQTVSSIADVHVLELDIQP
ncbi:MAG: hypothetical protein R2762_20630 [Bryobacteraceae bacterium]